MTDLDKVFFDALERGHARHLEKVGTLRKSSDPIRKLARISGMKVDDDASTTAANQTDAAASEPKKAEAKKANGERSIRDVAKDLFARNSG